MQLDAKSTIRAAVDDVIRALAARLSLTEEAVANEAFYHLQRHPQWGRNATASQKRASHRHWGGRCHRCGEEVPFSDAKFHHLKRGMPGQHDPSNLVPEHEHCHDEQHGVSRGSLSKGSPRKGQESGG